jgi:hypothetical protein
MKKILSILLLVSVLNPANAANFFDKLNQKIKEAEKSLKQSNNGTAGSAEQPSSTIPYAPLPQHKDLLSRDGFVSGEEPMWFNRWEIEFKRISTNVRAQCFDGQKLSGKSPDAIFSVRSKIGDFVSGRIPPTPNSMYRLYESMARPEVAFFSRVNAPEECIVQVNELRSLLEQAPLTEEINAQKDKDVEAWENAKKEAEARTPRGREKILSTAFTNYLLLSKCYESRKGYALVLTTEDRLSAAKSALRKFTEDFKIKNNDLDADKIWSSSKEEFKQSIFGEMAGEFAFNDNTKFYCGEAYSYLVNLDGGRDAPKPF